VRGREDKVIAVVRISGRAKLSGVETDLTNAELWTLRDGKVAWGRQYWTREQALEAAGLGEQPRLLLCAKSRSALAFTRKQV
jgi:ketosteroid isomerase-like protein